MIYYFAENVPMPRIQKRITKRWIEAVLREHGFELGVINFLFTDDNAMLKHNVHYLGHDFYTDILTFENRPYGVPEQIIYGDVIISTERVRDNACRMRLDYRDELNRVLIHAVLHLIGLGDKTHDEAAKMRLAEDSALYLLRTLEQQ